MSDNLFAFEGAAVPNQLRREPATAIATVIRLDDHRPRTSAESLLAEVRRTGKGQLPDVALPASLALALEYILEDVDYRSNPHGNAAKGCRLVAACADSLDSILRGQR